MNVKFSNLFLLLLICFLLTGCSEVSYLESEESKQIVVENDTVEESGEEKIIDNEMIFVQVSGAVINPGVYQLPSESRVFNAIAMAGGLTDVADDFDLNQASILSDGQKIYVYTIGERELVAIEDSNDGLININRASLDELCTLPGVGPSKAKMIIDYRESNGLYTSIDDIKNVQGIKEGTFAQIKAFIKI